MKRFLRSLLAKYLLIIFFAIILLQLAYLAIGTFLMLGNQVQQKGEEAYVSEGTVEENWHKAARNISHVSTMDQIKQLFQEWKVEYPEAGMFWVNAEGRLSANVDATENLPTKWTAVNTAAFIKERYNSDPFTVIAFVGESANQGFVVVELPRSVFEPPLIKFTEKYGVILFSGVIAIILLFILASFLFFRRIQKRLIYLQDAMEIRDVDGLPIEVDVKKEDEIGRLELSFNHMVHELRESREREQNEEKLRRELIANLSHDLRTPLTKVRAQTYSIMKEDLSDDGRKAIKAIDTSVSSIDRLIENLMSYTLLMASKYKYEPKEIDIARFVRESLATWYSAFEKEGFEIDASIDSIGLWQVDPIWMGRILDNLFQNVLRHANSGLYIGVKTESIHERDVILIKDHGNGFNHDSPEKGAGIGLTIVDRMIKGMELDWNIESNEEGTTIRIIKCKD